jgi:hypothetical protein
VQFIEQCHPALGGEFIARVSCPPEVAHHATAIAALRQDYGYLVRSSQSTQEVVIEAVQEVAEAKDGSLPACFDQGRPGSAASAAAIRGIAIARIIVRTLKRVHWVYVAHGGA